MLAGLYRSAHVGLVTPLRDGMNLVAKEYVAAQDPDDPGVLVLSQFAGAAQELTGALVVNPHETEGMAAAIKAALEMSPEERKERFQRMYDHLAENDIDRWAERFLSALGETREQPGLLSSLRQLFAVRA
jgi:trehalose 6-phosphate synthase